MDFARLTEKLMSMDDSIWERHANPWSVYTRFTILPLISIAFWSRELIGLYSVLPISLAFLWAWLNPRVFSVPITTNNWASMGTFGERIYLNRKHVPIPMHHVKPAKLLQILSALGLPIFIFGLYSLNFSALLLGNIWIMVFKSWFVDRMVWLFMDMQSRDSNYQRWLKS
ncbi:DUF6653 family protein [Oceanicoccus sp. KOV_DT_Chl]|uniref:DUF6653 family protein n=1 Tax=Oceanicoccus sp. KOV_DT_Chl TaxID=1904639 RepID=UPI000C7AE51C|nr:DUF6653 family protein [Oceanicoccus sp. KOV_DT_Chl]